MKKVKLLLIIAFLSLAFVGMAQEQDIMERLKALVVEDEEATTSTEEVSIPEEREEPVSETAEAAMAMPSQGDVAGKESEEPVLPLIVFKSKEDEDRLLGANPRFVYRPTGLRDPMIIPWIRREIIIQETLKKVDSLLGKGEYGEAKTLLEDVLDRYPKSKYTARIKKIIERIEEEIGKGPLATRVVVVLPGWIRTHTNGIVWDEEKPVVMIGDYALKVGDTVPHHDVKVYKIEKGTVTFERQGKLFPLEIKPLE